MKNKSMSYQAGIASRHNMSAEARSVGAHAKLPGDHPLAFATAPQCASSGRGFCDGAGGRSTGGLPASNNSVSDRSGPRESS